MARDLLLAIDGSTRNTSIAFKKNNSQKIISFLCEKDSAAESLLENIYSLINESSSSISEISKIGICTGPGSYTGLRTCLATAMGLVPSPEDQILLYNSFDLGLFENNTCLLYTSPSPRDKRQSRMPSSA